MCTFFLRTGVIAVLLSGCARSTLRDESTPQPVSRADTVVLTVPVLRFTPGHGADVSTPLDSISLELLERRVMARLASLMRAQVQRAAGEQSAGIPPVNGAAPTIQHGLLGTVRFNEDGSIDQASRDRISAIAEMMSRLDGGLDIRTSSAAGIGNIDVAIARARRVYLELLANKPAIAERDVAISVDASDMILPRDVAVEIFWRNTP